MNPAIIIGVIAGVIILIIILIYNSFIVLKNKVKNSWAQIDVQLKRRNDLIPNLVETIKGYTKHEKNTLENVTKARANINSNSSPSEKANSSNQLTGALKSLFAVAENYPNLKANTNFLKLQEEISETEDKISYTRQIYNDMVMLYNTKREIFPTNLIAKIFNFKKEELFETTDKSDVKVEI